ncbi:response regulator [Gloeothece verrucosa]|uniref:Response regulator receiver protein n=1 Tax=Gloeothece verrucosa (strain PCC 7822) TaxID=497965 RepID=E0UDI8_GLOV7|nr:response regulator [Gloeothece verrucosa]ADN15301.1 response regulator receiver protein [Gloeothece verrucosa PCC 7822]
MKQSDKASILIVDDQPDNLMLLEYILNSLEQNVIKAGSGEEAIKAINQQDFAVMILDVNMPVMDGFQLAEYIRNQTDIEPTPIIFLTGDGNQRNQSF